LPEEKFRQRAEVSNQRRLRRSRRLGSLGHSVPLFTIIILGHNKYNKLYLNFEITINYNKIIIADLPTAISK